MTPTRPSQPERFGRGANPTALPLFARTPGEGGGIMTQPREVQIQYVGGPFDSTFATVTLDRDGRPPQYPTTVTLGPADYRINPTTGPIADVVNQLYELDVRLDDAGATWVYRFTGETSMRPAA